MQHELFIATVAGLGGMLGWGLADFFVKKTIDVLGDVATAVWAHVFGTLGLIALVTYQVFGEGKPLAIPQDLHTWTLLVFFGALQAAVYLFLYKGFGKGQLAILNPIFASFSGLTAIMSIVIFGEVIGSYLPLALIIIFGGVLFINLDVQALKARRLSFIRTPGFKEVAFATVLAAFWTLFWDKFISGQDASSYVLFMYAFMTLVIFLVSRFQKVKLSGVTSNLWKFLILIGLCETLAYTFVSYGYSTTSMTSVVALLSGAFSLPTIFLARIFLKEKTTKTQTIGSVIIILGIVVLSLL